jgi:hypothetical protein
MCRFSRLKKDQLQSLSDILGLPATGRNDEHAERILNFLMEPIDEGKPVPERKLSMRTSQKSSTNSKESINTDDEEEEEEEKTEVISKTKSIIINPSFRMAMMTKILTMKMR